MLRDVTNGVCCHGRLHSLDETAESERLARKQVIAKAVATLIKEANSNSAEWQKANAMKCCAKLDVVSN